MNTAFRFCFVLILSVLLVLQPGQSFAQAPGQAGGQSAMPQNGPRRHLANIIFAGLAGAILGLSTLSFYGRPQDRLSNIAVGFAIGVIGGALYTTYKAAAEPKEFYGLRAKPLEPVTWSLQDANRATAMQPPQVRSALTFTF